MYAPKLFADVMRNSKRFIDFNKSLKVHDNEDQIVEAGQNGGGASGELFMCTHDKQILVKTITESEKKALINILYDYSVYMMERPDSMISKIYGLFEFQFPGASKPVRLVIMENIFTVNNDAILRRYDLKGSTYKRKAYNED